MNKRVFLLLGISILLCGQVFACGVGACSDKGSCGGGCSCSKANYANHQCTDSSAVTNTPKVVDIGNKNCTVEGNKIGSMGEPINTSYMG